MSNKIDVWELAKQLEDEFTPIAQKDVEGFVSSKNGIININDLVEIIGIVNGNNKRFTIELIQMAMDELQKDK